MHRLVAWNHVCPLAAGFPVLQITPPPSFPPPVTQRCVGRTPRQRSLSTRGPQGGEPYDTSPGHSPTGHLLPAAPPAGLQEAPAPAKGSWAAWESWESHRASLCLARVPGNTAQTRTSQEPVCAHVCVCTRTHTAGEGITPCPAPSLPLPPRSSPSAALCALPLLRTLMLASHHSAHYTATSSSISLTVSVSSSEDSSSGSACLRPRTARVRCPWSERVLQVAHWCPAWLCTPRGPALRPSPT